METNPVVPFACDFQDPSTEDCGCIQSYSSPLYSYSSESAGDDVCRPHQSSVPPSTSSETQSDQDSYESLWHCTDLSANCLKNASEPEVEMKNPTHLLKNESENDGKAQQIWSLTKLFLEEIRGKTGENAMEGMIDLLREANLSAHKPSFDMMSLLMHGMETARKLPCPHPKELKKTHFKSHLRLHKSKKPFPNPQNSAVRLTINGKPKAKTGRKPKSYPCAICPAVLPYKVSYIQHLQTCHQVNRSLSLLYKRVNQSPETLRKLYNL